MPSKHTPAPLIAALLMVVLAAGCSTPAATVQPSPDSSAGSPAASSNASASSAPTSSSPSQPNTPEAAADAFKDWVKQYSGEDWDKHYATLVREQQKLISAKKYVACRNKETAPTASWVKLVGSKPNVKTKIPGTSVTKRSVAVTARLRIGNSYTIPVTSHMFFEEGSWRWSMTKSNLARCK